MDEHESGRAERLEDHRRAVRRRRRVLAVGFAAALALSATAVWADRRDKEEQGDAAGGDGAATTASQREGDGETEGTPSTTPAPTTTTTPPLRTDVLVDPATVGQPWGTEVDGLLTFRGNPTRTWYGKGPVPAAPGVLWKFPEGAMCSQSSEKGETRTWCGSGWTGEPAVFERDGRTWVVFGAYDRAVHFLDAETGERILPDFPTGDIIKGSVTVDPDGYPLVYTGSRDNYYRVLAIDRPEPLELWKISAEAVSPTLWNNDWDGAGLILNDHLLEGGENSQFHVVKLNRGYGADGLVTVAPQLVFNTPSWDDELLGSIGDHEVSVENSVAVWEDTVFFANSGGLVQGWDVSMVRTGQGTPQRTFRFWTGDDTDATIVVDEEGYLYVGSEWERHTQRSRDNGQLMKLDPRRPENPLVWSIPNQVADKAGTWSTPAIVDDLVIWPTYDGNVRGVDRATGQIRWELDLEGPLMTSPVVVDDVLIQGDCGGTLRAYDLSDTTVAPPELWALELGGCIESTPAVWKGRIFVGTRAGFFFAIGDA